VCLCPAQVHAQQHLGPVLRLGTACARLNVDEGVIGIELTGEHAPKLERTDLLFVITEISDQLACDLVVVLLDGKLKQLGGIGEPGGQPVENEDDVFQLCPLLAECLCPLGFVPDIGILEFALYFGQALRLALVVKDTPLTR
jgi:hypothetical protein